MDYLLWIILSALSVPPQPRTWHDFWSDCLVYSMVSVMVLYLLLPIATVGLWLFGVIHVGF